jgi:hypothetical protein
MSKTKAVKTTKAIAPAAAGKSLALLDQELSQEVANLKNQVGAPTGRNLRLEPSGNFKTPEGLDLGNTIDVIIVDFVSRNWFYPGIFSKDNPTPPDCYAMGKDIATMKPEDDSPHKQDNGTGCAGCPLNAFGSGINGKSKACKNTRDLAVLLVDRENPDLHNEPDAPIYTLSVTPTSIKAFDAIVPVIARALGGPPIKAIVTVTATPVGSYATMKFSDPQANKDYAAHVARRGETTDLLYRKPDFAAYQARAAAAPQRRGVPARPAARPAPARAGARR